MNLTPFSPAPKRPLLRVLLSALVVAIAWPGSYAQAQQSVRSISQPAQDYSESTEDLSVKVLGGYVRITRSWVGGKWYLNDRWSDLDLQPDHLGGVGSVSRGGLTYGGGLSISTSAAPKSLPVKQGGVGEYYALAGSRPTYRLDVDNAISAATDSDGRITGWQWSDQAGNTIDYDGAGRMLGYANPAGVRVSMVRDSQGRLTGVQDHLGRQVITIAYNAAGLPATVSDNAGHSVSYQWTGTAASSSSPNGSIGLALLSQVTDSRGGTWNYTYTANGYIQSRTDPTGGQTTLSYLSQPRRGLVASSAAAGVGSTQLNQPQAARVMSFKGEAGAITNYRIDYNSIKQQYTVGIQLPTGLTRSLSYNRQGRVLQSTVQGMTVAQLDHTSATQTKVLGPRGGITFIDYADSSARRPIRIIYPDGSVESNEYNIRGNKTKTTNPLGVVSTWSYDSRGNLAQYVQAQGRPEQTTTRYTYNQYGLPLTKTLGRGNGMGADAVTETYQYDEAGNVTRITDQQGRSINATYTSRGQPATQTDALGRTTQYSYDAAGNLTSVTDPLNQTTRYTYDGMGRLTSIITPLGRVQTLSYDPSGNLTGITYPQSGSIAITYDPLGQPTSIKLPSGLTYTASYDQNGNLAAITDPAGNRTAFEYGQAGDPLAGLLTATQYPTFRETYQYDQQDRPSALTWQMGGGQSITQYLAFDAANRLVSATDANGNSATYQYDASGRPTQSTNPLAQLIKQTWDAQDNLLSVTDARGNTYRFEYDEQGNLLKEAQPSGAAIQYGYDDAGQLIKRTDAAGNIQTYSYDPGGNLTAEEHRRADTTLEERITYTYDADGQMTSYEQRDGAGNLISSASYTRDALGRTTQSSLSYGKPDGTVANFVIGQSFNQDGQLAGHRYPDGSQASYSYEQGRLSKITLPNGSSINYGNYNWTVPTSIQMPGATETISADALQRPSKIEVRNQNNQSLASRQYQYDTSGNITQIASELGQTQYSYDKLGRLTKATPDQNLQSAGLPVEQYSYDEAGNRITSQHQNGIWSYDQDNRLTSYPQITPFSGQSMALDTQVSYTAQGHIASEVNQQEQKDYGYNVAERLTSYSSTPTGASSPATQATYRYDPFGRRIAKTVKQGTSASTTTYFIYIEGTLLAEADENGRLTRAYGFNPVAAQEEQWSTEPAWLADVQNNSLADQNTSYHYLHTDHLSTPMLATDKNGNTSWQANRETFGATEVLPNSSIVMNLRFPGQYFDQETGQHYNFMRSYDPLTGRYTQPDPIGIYGGLNSFVYVDGNPVFIYDPYGLYYAEHWYDHGFAFVYWATNGWSPSQKVVNFSAGVGDMALSMFFINGQSLRNRLGIDGGINLCSSDYSNGQLAGMALAVIGPNKAGALRGAAQAERIGLGIFAKRELAITPKGLNRIREHLAKLDELPYKPNLAMLERLEAAMASGRRVSGADAIFYTHELAEATKMAQGLSYEAAHLAAIEKYRISPFSIYHSDVIRLNPDQFSSVWKNFWGIKAGANAAVPVSGNSCSCR